MPIKLLPKQEITRLQSQEKRINIEEGRKLAERIDTLREIAAKEEASLASFRVSTLKAIQAEVKQATTQKEELLKQVINLRSEIEHGHTALDERDRHLQLFEAALQHEEEKLSKRIQALDLLALQVDRQDKEGKSTLAKMQSAWTVLSELAKDTYSTHEQALTNLRETSKKVDTATTLAADLEKELRARDIEVASRERDVSIKEERINRTATELRERELQLLDRELTLEREIKRLNKTYEPNGKNPKR